MTAGIKANLDGSAAIQIGGTDVITLTSGGAATFVVSPTTVQAGTVSAPSITTSGDTNTGIFFPAADTIAFAEGGTEALRINSSAQIEFAAGSASTPSITFTGDTNTGIYSPAADTIAFAEGGVEALRINSSAQVEFTDGTASLPSITNSGDTNTGIYFSAADTVDIATGGTQRGQFDASGNFLFNSGYGSVATAFGCRAWATFTPSTGTILASGNMTSVSRNSTGNYTATFTNAMPDANYAMALGIANDGAGNSRNYYGVTSKTSSAYRFSVNAAGVAFDPPNMSVVIFR